MANRLKEDVVMIGIGICIGLFLGALIHIYFHGK